MRVDRLVQLSRESFVYGIGPIASRVASIALVPALTRVLSTDDYGLLSLLATFAGLASLGIGLGADSGVPLLFFESEDPERRRAVMSTYAVAQAVTAVVLGASVVLLAPWLAEPVFGRSDAATYIVLVGLIMVLTSAAPVATTLFRLQRRPRVVAILAVAQAVLNVTAILALVVGLGRGLLGYYVAALLVAALLGGVHLVLVRPWVAIRAFDRQTLRTLLGYGLPLLPTGYALFAINGLDRFILEHYRGLSEVAVYSVANTVASTIGFVTAAFQMAIGPFVLSIQNQPDARQVYADVLTAWTAVGCGLALGASLFAPEVLAIFMAPRYAPAASAVPFLAFYAFAVSASYVVAIGSWLAKRTTNLAWTTALGAVVNVALSVELVPSAGFFGSAVAIVLAELVYVGALAWASQRCFPIPYRWRTVLGLATLAATLAAIGRWSDGRFDLASGVLLKTALGGLYAAAIHATGAVPRALIRGSLGVKDPAPETGPAGPG